MFSHTNARHSLLMLVLYVALALSLFAAVAQAAMPDLRDPNSIVSWLKLQTMALGWIVTLVWKHAPVVKDYSNRAAAWLALLLFIATTFGTGVGTAQAATGAGGGALSTSVRWAVVIANSAISKVLWDGWLKPTVGDWLDRQLGREPQTPTFRRGAQPLPIRPA